MRYTIRTPILATLFVLLTAAPARSQEGSQDMNAAMKAWKDAATPGAMHKTLDMLVGKWDASVTMTMGPEGQAQTSKATSAFAWILDGRFLEQTFTGEMMGMPLHGRGLFGYDNFSRKYTTIWIDNSTTAILYAEGHPDQSGKVITFYGTMDEPMTGEHDKNVKYIMRLVDDRTMVYEIHDLTIGESNTKVLEITYRKH